VLIVATILFSYITLVIESSEIHDEITSLALWMDFFVYFWFIQFILSCQHFVIAGAVSQWFFTRDKTKVHSPIKKAFSNLLKFHLGSACFGSLILWIAQTIWWIWWRCIKVRNSDSVDDLITFNFLAKRE